MSDDGEQILRGLSDTDELLTGTVGGDILSSGSGNDTLSGVGGDDRLIARAGDDSLSGGDGDDRLGAGAGKDTLDGGAGNDTLWDGDGNDLHFGGLGQDMLVGRAGSDTLNGGEGFDRIYGGIDDDALSGGGGNDFVFGGADNDTVSGGAGFDKLTGGEGADVFLVEPGSGTDVIRDFEPGVDRIDISALGLGLSFEHLIIEQMGPHTWIGFRNGEGLTLYTTDAASISAADFIGLSSSTTASLRLIDRGADDALTGGDGNDYVRGDAGANALAGGAGNDDLWDGGGADSLYGGGGDDRLRAGGGDDVLEGGTGADRLSGGDGNDLASGGAGDDFIFGGAGDDTLDGGAGADILTGGAGADTFVAGEGGDVIRDFSPGEDVVDLSGRDISFSDLAIQAVGPHALVALPSGDTILLFNTQPGDLSESDFDFGAASPPPANPGDIFGTDGDDSIAAIDANSLSGLAGNDTLDLRANFGEAFGGDGNDDITIGLTPGTTDIVFSEAFGGAGDDTIRSIDEHSFANGGDGNDLIDVAARTFVDGGTGDDTLSYSGDGVAIYDASHQDPFATSSGAFVVNGAVDAAINIENLGTGIVAGIIGTTGTAGDDVIGDDDVLQASNFGVSNIFAAAGNDTVYGFAGNDSIRGQFGDDLLFGGRGNDALQGNAGNDTLDGGTGDNTLTGGGGADVFVIGLGDTGQTITDFSIGEDQIDFGGPSEVFGELTLADTADGAAISIDGRQIVVLNGLAAADLTANSLLDNQAIEIFSPGTNDPVVTTAAEEHVFGGGGNDTLSDNHTLEEHSGFMFGDIGHDRLSARYDGGALFGGEGNDNVRTDSFFSHMDPGQPTHLFGGEGDDTIQIGDPNDIGYGGAGDDVIVINPGGKFFGGEGDDTLFFWAGPGPEVIIDLDAHAYVWEGGVELLGDVENVNAASNEFGFISTGQFADTDAGNGSHAIGDGISDANAQQRILAGGGADTVFGFDHDDLLFGGSGTDEVYGGDDNDTLHGDGGHDLLEGGHGNDVLFGGNGRDTLIGGSGDNILSGGIANDDFVIRRPAVNEDGAHTVITDFEAGHDQINGVLRLSAEGLAGGSGITLDHLASGGTVTLEGLTLSDLTTGLAAPTGNEFAAEDGGIMLFRFEENQRIFFGYEPPEATHFGDYLVGGATEDTLLGLGGNDTIYGGEGDDNVNGGGGDDLLFGGLVESGGDKDRLYGGGGNDTLIGDGSHGATLFGGAGDDVLRNGSSDGHLFGGDGNDMLFAGASRTEITGGTGEDVLVFDQQFDDLPVVVRDFEQDVDLLDFSELGISFSDISHADNRIIIDGHLAVRFEGGPLTLTEDDFIF